jgi:steroid delta-isomerase-like uncharacterized protein
MLHSRAAAHARREHTPNGGALPGKETHVKPAENLRAAVDAFNRHDAAAFASTYARDATLRDPFYSEPVSGRESIERDAADFFRAFPDMHTEIVRTVEANGNLAVEYVLTGTHQGPLVTPGGHIPPTGKAIRAPGSAFSEFNADGEVSEERRYYDVARILQQLGLQS